jgi:carbon-monoxide dehydrogenase large subunit
MSHDEPRPRPRRPTRWGTPMKRKEDPRFIRGHGASSTTSRCPNMLYVARAQPVSARAHRQDRQDRRARGARRPRGAHRRRSRRRTTWPGYRRSTATTSRWCSPSARCSTNTKKSPASSRPRASRARRGRARRRRVRTARSGRRPVQSRRPTRHLRDDRENKTNHIYHWEVGKRAETDAALAPPTSHQGARRLPALPSGAARTVRHHRRHEPGDRPLTLYHDLASAARAPHRRLARHRHPRGQDPRHLARHRRRLRQQGPGLSRLRRRGRRVGRARRPGQVDRDAHREPHDHRVRARLPHGRRDRRDQRRQGHGAQGGDVADHGAFDAAADPDEVSGRLFGIVTGSYDFPTAFTELDAYFTNKAPGGVAYRCSFRVTEASFAIERGMDMLARELNMDPPSCA